MKVELRFHQATKCQLIEMLTTVTGSPVGLTEFSHAHVKMNSNRYYISVIFRFLAAITDLFWHLSKLPSEEKRKD